MKTTNFRVKKSTNLFHFIRNLPKIDRNLHKIAPFHYKTTQYYPISPILYLNYSSITSQSIWDIIYNISCSKDRGGKIINYVFLVSLVYIRLRLRLQICLNLTPVSIYLNFRLIFYFIETHVQEPKIIKTCI